MAPSSMYRDTNLQSAPNPADFKSKPTVMLCLLLAVITLLVYNRAASSEFINFDDPQYVTNNSHIREGLTWSTIQWAFTTYEAGNWHPLTWLSHALDAQLIALNPAGHHYVNVLFHVINSLLLFLVLLSATRSRWLSWLAAAIWALHPVNVESVAWVSERKNLLSMFFFLLAMHAYEKYARGPRPGKYVLTALLFSLGLMAKPQVITFPFVLLLWDYWPLRRLGSAASTPPASSSILALTGEKMPLLLLSTASAVITMRAQQFGHAVRTTAEFSFSVRIENALLSYVRYIEKFFWPHPLSPFYAHPENTIPAWQAGMAGTFLLLVTALVLWQRRRSYLLVGWFWFLGTLVPMIGLVQVGQQAMADRYAYLPFIGLLLMVVWGGHDLLASLGWRRELSIVGAIAILVALSALTYRQLGYWRNSEILWSHALQVSDRNYTAHSNLADALARQGRSEEAIVHYEAAESLHAYPPSQLLSLGLYELQHGHGDAAIQQFKRVQQSPDPSLKQSALDGIGAAYLQRGSRDLAKESYARALEINPGDAHALLGLGVIAYPTDPASAATYFSRAVAIQPSDVSLLLLATALHKHGRSTESAAAVQRAQQISPNLSQAQETVSRLLEDPNSMSK